MAEELLTIQVASSSREDTILMQEGTARVERGLILRGAKPELFENDRIISVNGYTFNTLEELVAILLKPGNGPLRLTVARSKQSEGAADAGLERVIIEVKKPANSPLGVTCKDEPPYVVVARLTGIAQSSALRIGDHIVAVNGKRVSCTSDLRRLIAGAEELTFHVTRSSNQVRPTAASVQQPAPAPSAAGGETEERVLKVTVPYQEGEQLGLFVDQRLNVTRVVAGSPAAGLFMVGDRLLGINTHRLVDDKAFYRLLGRMPDYTDELVVDLTRRVPKESPIEKPRAPPSHPAPIPTRPPAAAPRPSPELKRSDSGLLTICLQMSSGEPIGVHPDEKLMVNRIQKGSHGDGKFELGDVIKSVNGKPIVDANHFFRVVEVESQKQDVRVVVERNKAREIEIEMGQLPPNMEQIIERHAGFDYRLVNLKFDPREGRKFGLFIANVYSHKVIVTGLEEGGVAGDYLKVYDHLIAINGQPVTDQTVAQQRMTENSGNFEVIIERPTTVETQTRLRNDVDQWKNHKAAAPNTEQMPSDVQDIVRAEVERRRSRQGVSPAPVIKPAAITRASSVRISFHPAHTETAIQSDVPPDKQLSSVK